MCNSHYEAFRLRSGHFEKLVFHGDIAKRLEQKIDRNGPEFPPLGRCWQWTGALASGYGRVVIDGRVEPAHRVMYEREVAPVDRSLDLDHLCRNRSCVNPAHMEPVTRRVNLIRGETRAGRASRRDTCANGHLMTPQNTYTWRGTRQCRACRTAAGKRRTR